MGFHLGETSGVVGGFFVRKGSRQRAKLGETYFRDARIFERKVEHVFLPSLNFPMFTSKLDILNLK